MKKLILLAVTFILIFSFVGCVESNKYSESEIMGTWMTQESIEAIQQMDGFQRTHLQNNISSLRICESNAVVYTPTSHGDVKIAQSYKIKGDSIVVTSTIKSSGKFSSGKKVYNIVSTDNGYELELDGERYIKICDDPYVYDVSKYLE